MTTSFGDTMENHGEYNTAVFFLISWGYHETIMGILLHNHIPQTGILKHPHLAQSQRYAFIHYQTKPD